MKYWEIIADNLSKCHGKVENQHHNGGTVGMLNFRNNDPMFFSG